MLVCGDAVSALRQLPSGIVQTCVTSPPYFGLRDYGVDGQLGLEETPEEYVDNLVDVFREVRRVLRYDGTLWLNLGDSYSAVGKSGGGAQGERWKGRGQDYCGPRGGKFRPAPPGLKPKNLIGIPWRVAFALQADGWYLRSDIIWAKPNPMPSSVRDRPTSSHEYLFLLSKSPRYYYDAEAIREKADMSSWSTGRRLRRERERQGPKSAGRGERGLAYFDGWSDPTTRNKRDVWEIDNPDHTPDPPYTPSVWKLAVGRFQGAHFATFPPGLVEPCIKAGTSEKGCCRSCGAPWVRRTERTRTPTRPGDAGEYKTEDPQRHVTDVSTVGWDAGCTCGVEPAPCLVLDPFGGAMTTGLVAYHLGRRFVGIELNPGYLEMGRKRLCEASGVSLPDCSAGLYAITAAESNREETEASAADAAGGV
jgi:DNA modification methylase